MTNNVDKPLAKLVKEEADYKITNIRNGKEKRISLKIQQIYGDRNNSC